MVEAVERRRGVLGRGERWRALALSVALVAIVIWPVVRRPPRDSFPHSTYPMFSENRAPVADIEVVVGRTLDGRDITLSPELIAGTEEVIVAGSLVRTSVRRGPDAASDLCHDVAQRIAGQGPPDVDEVVVRTDRHDAIAWFQGDRAPLERTIHSSCQVVR